jgi:hypothetical protein
MAPRDLKNIFRMLGKTCWFSQPSMFPTIPFNGELVNWTESILMNWNAVKLDAPKIAIHVTIMKVQLNKGSALLEVQLRSHKEINKLNTPVMISSTMNEGVISK